MDEMSLGPDSLDPALVDWRTVSDTLLYTAAQGGVRRAIAELERRTNECEKFAR